jgi:DNA modification methylase
MTTRIQPGEVRDAIVSYLRDRGAEAAVSQIEDAVRVRVQSPVPSSSVRSYLALNTPDLFQRVGRGRYALNGDAEFVPTVVVAEPSEPLRSFRYGKAMMVQGDCMEWLAVREPRSIHAVVTDPPYGLLEYTAQEQSKLRSGRGGVWRIPPSFDGHKRSPLPRFTVLQQKDLDRLRSFFRRWATLMMPCLVPGGHVVMASNPLLSYAVSHELAAAGFERRGEIVRLVMTMRGGDRPKNAHEEFAGVTVMPRSMWEPWLVFRKPLEGRVQDNLRAWKTGGFRRVSDEQPFGDVIRSHPTNAKERALAPHPSLKPQSFLRKIVRAVLPLGVGTVLDPFAGSGSTLAACASVGYESIGVELDARYFTVAEKSIPKLIVYRDEASLYNQH